MKEKLKNISLEKWHIAIIIIGIIFVSLGAFHENIWFDESYSVAIAKHSFADIWTIGGNDVHPVLYYWGLHIIYLIIGNSILAYRLFSIIPIAIMIILGYTHIRKDFGKKTGLIFSFLSAFLPVMAAYAIEIRMYSWAMLTVTLLSIYAYRLVKEDNTKNWIIFGLSSLMSIYLHYYGLMAAGLINIILLVYLIVKKRKKGIIFILAFGLVQGVAYIPWIMKLLSQMGHVSNGFWIGFTFPKTLMELVSCQLAGQVRTGNYKELIIPTIFTVALYAYIIYKICKFIKEKQNLKPFLWSVGVYFLVIMAAVIITIILKTSIVYYRYLFVITGLYIFAISFILGKEKNNICVIAVFTVIAGLGIYNNVIMISDNYSSSNREVINYMQENIQEGDSIVYKEISVGSIPAIHFKDNQNYFYNEENWGVEEAYRAFEPNYSTETTKDFIEECSNRIWVIDTTWGNTTQKITENTEYKVISQKEFYTAYHDYHYKITLIER